LFSVNNFISRAQQLFLTIKVENKVLGSMRPAAWVNSRADQEKSKTSRAADRLWQKMPTIKVENKVDIEKLLPQSMQSLKTTTSPPQGDDWKFGRAKLGA
jgi:hypothetical protein